MHLDVYRSQRVLTGASTLINKKKGRRMSVSTISSFHMSVVTHLSCQRFVTKVSNASNELNERSLSPFMTLLINPWLVPLSVRPELLSEVEESGLLAEVGSEDGRERWICLKPWPDTKKFAMEAFPAQMPT